MSEITVNIIAPDQAVHQSVPRWIAQALFASLATDPLYLNEVEVALGRFCDESTVSQIHGAWSLGTRFPVANQDSILLHLAGRYIAMAGAVSFTEHGHVAYNGKTGPALPYSLSNAWHLASHPDDWCAHVRQRIEQAQREPAVNHRKILYECPVDFIVNYVLDNSANQGNLAQRTHAAWLTTARTDLHGRTPRHSLFLNHAHLEEDLQHQGQAWVLLNRKPPRLPRQSRAYRDAAFSINEIILYYDLLRLLAESAVTRLANKLIIDETAESDYLHQLKQEWLHSPNVELDGLSPAQIIDLQRARVPLTDPPWRNGAGELAIAGTGSAGPTFLYLDGSHMDDQFVFSLHENVSDWREEKEHLVNQIEQWTVEENSPAIGKHELSLSQGWNQRDQQWRNLRQMPANHAVPAMMFFLGAYLFELGTTAESTPELQVFREHLKRDFERLTRVLERTNVADAHVRILQLANQLYDLALACPNIRNQCRAVARRLVELDRRLNELDDEQPTPST